MVEIIYCWFYTKLCYSTNIDVALVADEFTGDPFIEEIKKEGIVILDN
jgi:hypothetical protein